MSGSSRDYRHILISAGFQERNICTIPARCRPEAIKGCKRRSGVVGGLISAKMIPIWGWHSVFYLGGIALGRLMDRTNPYRVLGIAYAIGALSVGAIGFFGVSVPLMMTAITIGGFCAVGGQTSANALAANSYPTTIQATGVGWPPVDEGLDREAFRFILRCLDTGRCWVKLSPRISKQPALPFSDTLSLCRRWWRARRAGCSGDWTGRIRIISIPCRTMPISSTSCLTGFPTRRRATLSWSTIRRRSSASADKSRSLSVAAIRCPRRLR